MHCEAMNTMPKFNHIEQLDSVVRRLGNPESAILLHSSCSIFCIPHVDGIIGYHKIGHCAVVIGDPICLPQDVSELASAFHHYCKEQNLKIVYFLIHHDFATWAIHHECMTLIKVGEELSINPTKFQKRQKLRWKVNQAIKHGVTVKEYKELDAPLEKQIIHTIDTWQKERKGPQMYLGKIDVSNIDTQRIFYAQKDGKIIGILLLSPIDTVQGWTVTSYLALTDAPVGTTEHLLCATFDTLANENCQFLCLGIASGLKLGEAKGLGPVAKFLANIVFKTVRWAFRLDSRGVYLNKYHPNTRPVFLLTRDKLGLTELFAIKHLLNVKL